MARLRCRSPRLGGPWPSLEEGRASVGEGAGRGRWVAVAPAGSAPGAGSGGRSRLGAHPHVPAAGVGAAPTCHGSRARGPAVRASGPPDGGGRRGGSVGAALLCLPGSSQTPSQVGLVAVQALPHARRPPRFRGDRRRSRALLPGAGTRGSADGVVRCRPHRPPPPGVPEPPHPGVALRARRARHPRVLPGTPYCGPYPPASDPL